MDGGHSDSVLSLLSLAGENPTMHLWETPFHGFRKSMSPMLIPPRSLLDTTQSGALKTAIGTECSFLTNISTSDHGSACSAPSSVQRVGRFFCVFMDIPSILTCCVEFNGCATNDRYRRGRLVQHGSHRQVVGSHNARPSENIARAYQGQDLGLPLCPWGVLMKASACLL